MRKCLFLLLLSTDVLFAIVPRGERFEINNISDGPIFFFEEINADPITTDDAWFVCEINDMVIEIIIWGLIRLESQQQSKFLSIYPTGPEPVKERFDKLAQIPFLDKLRAILKYFIITDAEGNILLSLENLDKNDFVRQQWPLSTDTYVLTVGNGDSNTVNDREFPLETVEIQRFRTKHDVDVEEAKIHIGPYSNELTRSMHALAVTIGTDIYFRDRAYNPGSEEGQRILAHELTHIAQYEEERTGRNETRETLEREALGAETGEVYRSDPEITLRLNGNRYRIPKSKLKYYAQRAAEKIAESVGRQRYRKNEEEYLQILCGYQRWLGGK